MIKEFDSCIILTDTLKERRIDTLPINWEESDISVDPDEMDETKPDEKKFYQIESKITFAEEGMESFQTFVVHTYNVDRAMMLITDYVNKKQEERVEKDKERGLDTEKKEFHAMVESAKPIPVGRFIPREFSMAYIEVIEQ